MNKSNKENIKMLQNDAVRTLQYDSEIRVAQTSSANEPRGNIYITIYKNPRRFSFGMLMIHI